MSAINEWFGYYNAIFTYIERTYGQAELDNYLAYLAKVPNSDVSALYREGGLPAIEARHAANFRKDGDETSVSTERTDDTLTMRVHCPAFYASPEGAHPDRKVGPFLCACCKKLEGGILREAGYTLTVAQDAPGDCVWRVTKAK